MECHVTDKRPTWWLLYAIAAVLVGLVALIESSDAGYFVRVALELLVVVVMGWLVLRWIRSNRGRIELAETPSARQATLDLALRNGTPAARSADCGGLWLERPGPGHRRASSNSSRRESGGGTLAGG